MEIKSWTPSHPFLPMDAEAWDAFVLGHPAGTVFHTTRWQEILSTTYRRPFHHLAAVEADEIKGLLSLYRVRGLSGKKTLYSLPFTAYGGLLFQNAEAARMLCDRAQEIAGREGAKTVVLRNMEDPGLGFPGTDLHVHFAKPLPATDQECLDSIPRKSRATIRKAISNHGLTYEVNQDWPALWELAAVNLKRLGTPMFSKTYYRRIMEVLGPDADILFVKYQGKRVCGVMNFYYKDVCNPYFSGSLAEYNFTGCNNYMYYALMCHALGRGSRVFDFGKSRKGSGSFDFKLNMGFEPRTLPFQFILAKGGAIPSFNPSNPRLALFLKVWSGQPLWTSKILGSLLNRFLP